MPQNTIKAIAPDGKIETSYYDTYGRLVKFLESNPDISKLRTNISQYSPLGKLISKDTTFAGKTETTSYGYDTAGNLIFVKMIWVKPTDMYIIA